MKVNKPFGILFRFYLYLKEKFDPRPEVTDEERYAVNITTKLIKSPESVLYLAPISQKKYVKNDEKSIFVVVEGSNITIINHIYSYSVYIENSEFLHRVHEIFNTTMEERRNELESEIRKNIQHSLKNILDNLS